MHKLASMGLLAAQLLFPQSGIVLLLAAQVPSESGSLATLQDQVSSIKPGSRIEVRLVGNEKVRGKLNAVSAHGITIQLASGGERVFTFGEITSVKRVNPGRVMYAIIAVVVVVGLVILGAACGESGCST